MGEEGRGNNRSTERHTERYLYEHDSDCVDEYNAQCGGPSGDFIGN